MLWVIMGIIGILLIIGGVAWYHYDEYSIVSVILCGIGAFGTLFGVVGTPAQICDERNFFTTYEMLSVYTEDYHYENDTEKAVIAGQKYEYNKELIKTQASAKNHPWAYFNPDRILNLEFLQ